MDKPTPEPRPDYLGTCDEPSYHVHVKTPYCKNWKSAAVTPETPTQAMKTAMEYGKRKLGETPSALSAASESTAHLYVPKAQYDAKVAKMNAEAADLRSKLSTAERERDELRKELNRANS